MLEKYIEEFVGDVIWKKDAGDVKKGCPVSFFVLKYRMV